MDESNDAYPLALTLQDRLLKILTKSGFMSLTDRQAKAKNFKTREIAGKTVKSKSDGQERLQRHWGLAGKPTRRNCGKFRGSIGGGFAMRLHSRKLASMTNLEVFREKRCASFTKNMERVYWRRMFAPFSA